jgi:hypothetical protein
MSGTPPHSPRTTRILLALIAVLLGVIAALAGALLQIADHASIPTAIQNGACAFTGTIILTLAVLHFLTDTNNPT